MALVMGRQRIQINLCMAPAYCYCQNCRNMRVITNRRKTFDELRADFEAAYEEEERAINETFQHVFEQVCMNKAYRLKIEEEGGYKSVTWYFRSQGDAPELAKEKAQPILDDCTVFDKFDQILENLKQCPFVDIRRMKRVHLTMALNASRLHDLNAIFRPRSAKPEPGDELYEEDDFQDLIQMISNNPVIASIECQVDDGSRRRCISNLMRRISDNVHRNRRRVGNRQRR